MDWNANFTDIKIFNVLGMQNIDEEIISHPKMPTKYSKLFNPIQVLSVL